jgi:hypothetical protein
VEGFEHVADCEWHQRTPTHEENGVFYCPSCFREAVIEADAVELEKQVGPFIRAYSVSEVLRRLEGRR